MHNCHDISTVIQSLTANGCNDDNGGIFDIRTQNDSRKTDEKSNKNDHLTYLYFVFLSFSRRTTEKDVENESYLCCSFQRDREGNKIYNNNIEIWTNVIRY